jgi:choline dehydrogenase-like flavoprotein
MATTVSDFFVERLYQWGVRRMYGYPGSVFPTSGGVNPSLTIQAIACRTADRIVALARRGEL